MTNTLNDTYKFELRFASTKEIESLIEFLAENNFKDRFFNKEIDIRQIVKERNDFVKKERAIIQNLVGDKVMVQDFNTYNISIYVYNYIQEFEEHKITSITARVLKTPKGMMILKNDDVIFDLEHIENFTVNRSDTSKGRPNKPTDRSIQKTLEINEFIRTNSNKNIAAICKNFGISKATYYRVIKWLEVRNV
ncbi:hypothetical protein J8281_18580 [Aquimarina sp. U1-2]|uniref:hypothetical protein n=1 Tax=Aquimarina sp. U1-2 TaxID=2823141 RepID=UPI001AECADF5|nr:hypothetical protein [Aquimarina sp. U1-2]MBP2834210.1 hypothetical protein [Aquimarina sp. U1-2]